MPSPTSAPADLLRALAHVLADVGAAWYVFGAQAVLVWGRPRFTADIDVTVRLVPEEPERFVAAMAQAGFAIRFEAGDDFVRRTRVLPFVHQASGWPLDVVLAGPGLEERFLSRAVSVDFGDDLRVPVLCAEDLIVTKVLAGRPNDLEDIRGILRERVDRLDLADVRQTLEALEEALGVSDLLPVFEVEVAQSRSRTPE